LLAATFVRKTGPQKKIHADALKSKVTFVLEGEGRRNEQV
jgi:hypothetical protein